MVWTGETWKAAAGYTVAAALLGETVPLRARAGGILTFAVVAGHYPMTISVYSIRFFGYVQTYPEERMEFNKIAVLKTIFMVNSYEC
jgi:hypothetical protein